jgi:hypothetical protein
LLDPRLEPLTAIAHVTPDQLQPLQISFNLWRAPEAAPKTKNAPSRSITAAEGTTALRSSPVVSTRICRFLPPIFFAPS